MIESGNPVKSLELIRDHILSLEKTKNYAALPDYLEVLGRAHLAISDEKKANVQVESQIAKWGNVIKDPKGLKDLWIAAAGWYEYIGLLERAYQAEAKAVAFARQEPGISSKELGKLLVVLGSYSVNRMDLTAAKIHLQEAQALLEKEPDPESIYRINSFLGNMAYFASKLDSAEFYYKKCLLAFEMMEPSPRNTHYRPAIVLNNLSGVQSAQGKTTESIQSMNGTIAHLKAYQGEEKDPGQRMKGKEFYFQAIDNLGGVYKGLGNFRKAQDLLEFSYEKKKESFSTDSKEVWLSEILLGQLYFEQDEPDKARKILIKGLNGLKETDGNYLLYEADGWYALARIEDHSGNDALASEHYKRADGLFREGLEGEFDVIYLGFLRNYALFLAEIGNDQEAINMARVAYDYVLENEGQNSLMAFQQQLSVGSVFFELQRYQDSQTWSQKALENLKAQFSGTKSLLDSLQIERNRPQTILLSAKSRFEISKERSPEFLNSLLKELESGLEALDRRKTYLENDEDVNLMIRENQEYFKFVEQLNLELYRKTNDKDFLANLLSVHESALYQRIRARLEQVDKLRFGDIPATFFQKEQDLKTKLRASIQSSTDGVENYLKASNEWEAFLTKSRQEYPEYFEFRYASIQRNFEVILKQVPEATTVIRYLFVGEDLYALVLENSDYRLFQLDFEQAEKILGSYQKEWSDGQRAHTNLHQLYQSLWEPLEGAVSNERVLVVPDGILFNLNFEILTPKKIKTFDELATGSLLARHSFSYHYSTLLFSYPTQDRAYRSNFAAFAPGFFDEMKTEYLHSVKDSLQIDRSYLTLIPQPFTDRLVTGLKRIFGGEIFTKEASTLDQFNQQAGHHRILHIGTHAQSDNISPDFSKLIFAKAAGDPERENALFVKDIYQLDLRSELAVLMACETGKPTFAPGEGMISLAHAFNYAGSKSLLMGIWKIDEQASAEIAETFYNYLYKGMTKDKALQQAKLDYLDGARGRSLSPEFWAGLIVMGDSSPVHLDPVFESRTWVFFGLALLLFSVLCLWWFKRRKIARAN
ncbi:CHAT domain-containing protein [Algoriphagus jejuensis]|uniref:CHAT domain-containing protein n=2 Tax=Algoriphagus jejuensis TaxID=419934 RepID=A0ABN1MVH5_9BACT